MSELRISRTMAAPSERLWDLITDLDRWSEAISGIDEVERLDDGTGFGVGTKWRETRTMFGKKATEEMEVTSIDEGSSYTVEADGPGAHYVSTWTLTPDGDGTNVEMVFRAEPTGTLSRVMAATLGKLFEGPTRKAMEADFDDIAKAVEAA